jgi:NAD(P)-dependent dehydrogenase (short-subunit alcohol dehydrogenase family)
MKNDYVLITGGSKGIGAGIVKRLLQEGYKMIVLDIEEPENNENVMYFKVDLHNLSKTEEVLAEVCNRHQIVRLVNNVGIVMPALIEETDPEDFLKVLTLNARTSMCCVKACLPAMKDARFGRIVSITSRVILGKEMRTSYAASKGALSAMTRTWALELASYGITVNDIAPGPINTEAFMKNNPPDSHRTRDLIDRIPVNRIGTSMDVAHAVNFFLDDKSGFVTGQTLFVCGGLTVGLNKT